MSQQQPHRIGHTDTAPLSNRALLKLPASAMIGVLVRAFDMVNGDIHLEWQLRSTTLVVHGQSDNSGDAFAQSQLLSLFQTQLLMICVPGMLLISRGVGAAIPAIVSISVCAIVAIGVVRLTDRLSVVDHTVPTGERPPA